MANNNYYQLSSSIRKLYKKSIFAKAGDLLNKGPVFFFILPNIIWSLTWFVGGQYPSSYVAHNSFLWLFLDFNDLGKVVL